MWLRHFLKFINNCNWIRVEHGPWYLMLMKFLVKLIIIISFINKVNVFLGWTRRGFNSRNSSNSSKPRTPNWKQPHRSQSTQYTKSQNSANKHAIVLPKDHQHHSASYQDRAKKTNYSRARKQHWRTNSTHYDRMKNIRGFKCRVRRNVGLRNVSQRKNRGCLRSCWLRVRRIRWRRALGLMIVDRLIRLVILLASVLVRLRELILGRIRTVLILTCRRRLVWINLTNKKDLNLEDSPIKEPMLII